MGGARTVENITFGADGRPVAVARERARDRHTTPDAESRRRLASRAATDEESDRRRRTYENLMASLADVRSGGRLARGELNERGG